VIPQLTPAGPLPGGLLQRPRLPRAFPQNCVVRHRPAERETIGSVAARALTEDSAEVEFLTGDPVAQAVTCQRVTSGARAPRCGRYVCATAGRV